MSTNSLRSVASGNVAPKKTFAGTLEDMKPQLAAALPKHISPDRMIRVALTCYRQIPDLRKCTPESVIGAVVQCAQLGLEPGLLGQAYLIPFKKNWKDKQTGQWMSQMECQFIPGYKGLISLARRSGDVTSINATAVHKNDEFEIVLGVDPNIKHIPNLVGDRGEIVLVYAVAKFRDGGYHMEWMTRSEIEAIRNRSKAKDSGPWVTDWEQMAKKTVIRRMSNYLPMSVEYANAITASDAADLGKSVVIDGDYAEITDDETSGEALPANGTAEAHTDAGKASDTDAKQPSEPEQQQPSQEAAAARQQPRHTTQRRQPPAAQAADGADLNNIGAE